MRFYDRKEVRDLMAYLSFLHNPRDEVALLRILNYPSRGIGRETVHRLQEKSLSGGRPLVEVMEGASSTAGVAERQAGAVTHFLEHTNKMRAWFAPGRLAVAARRLVDSVGLEDAVVRSVKDREAGLRKAENLREAVSALAAFELQEPEAGLGDYLAAVNLSGKEEESAETSADSVVLLTVHSAKGLEFPFVFLSGFEEGLFPHERSCTTPGGLEEERRLAYVGMTRAMQELTITYAGERTRWVREIACLPSRFLDEIPEETVVRARAQRPPEKIDPEEEAKTAGEYLARIRSRL
jgi:superfamily I DNA/RNA helicase